MEIHDLSCCMGMATAGSGEVMVCLPEETALRMTAVLQAPTTASPVALVKLARAASIAEGAMPFTVCP